MVPMNWPTTSLGPFPCLTILMEKKVSLALSLGTSKKSLAPSSLPLPANSDTRLSPALKAEDIQLAASPHTSRAPAPDQLGGPAPKH